MSNLVRVRVMSAHGLLQYDLGDFVSRYAPLSGPSG